MFKLDTRFMDQMKKEPKYNWFKPILAVIMFLVFNTIFGVITAIAGDIVDAIRFGDAVDGVNLADAVNPNAYLQVDLTDPVALFIFTLPYALLILEVHLAMKVAKLGGLKTLQSTAYKLRVARFKDYLPLLVVLYLVFGIVEDLVSVFVLGDPMGQFRFPFLSLIVIVIMVPLQCMAEEYMFRGFVMQAIKSWIPVAVIAYILQAVIFMAGHGYNILGNLGTLVSGFLFGYAAIRTGGLEAPMAMHIANNVTSFIFSALFVGNETNVDITGVELVLDIIVSVCAFCIVMYISKKKGYLVENDPAPVEADAAVETSEVENASENREA